MAKLYQQCKDCEDYLKTYAGYLTRLLSALNHKDIETIAECFLSARGRGSTIFFAGNGGSAATASHFAQDLGEVGRKSKTEPFRTQCLNDNMPFITALSNDYGYQEAFSGQLKNLFRKCDVLVILSASGNSPNVLAAAKLAKELGGKTIGFVGFEGGELSKICDQVIHVKTNKGEYGPVEDMHLMLGHMITSYLITREITSKKSKK